VFNAGFQTLTT